MNKQTKWIRKKQHSNILQMHCIVVSYYTRRLGWKLAMFDQSHSIHPIHYKCPLQKSITIFFYKITEMITISNSTNLLSKLHNMTLI